MWLLRRLGILGVAVLPLVLGQGARRKLPGKGACSGSGSSASRRPSTPTGRRPRSSRR